MPLPNGSVHRFWCRPGGATSRSPKCGVASACGILRSPCVLRVFFVRSPCVAPSGRSRSPAHQEKKGEKKKNGDAEFAPASPMIKCVFSIFPLLSGIFKNYFSAISTTQG